MTPSQPQWQLTQNGDDSLKVNLEGDWNQDIAGQLDPQNLLKEILKKPGIQQICLSTTGLEQWNSILMTFLIGLINQSRDAKLTVNTEELPESIRALLDLNYAVPDRAKESPSPKASSWLFDLGLNAQKIWQDSLDFTRFLGEALLSFIALATGKARYRKFDLWLNIQDCGPAAVPIVTLISLLVGLILAFVGAVQLAMFGAEIYIADLVALGMTREMGALMTGIIMSGRTGAAFAAQIGTMNVNLEISALRVMGFTPMEFLVLPRMLALILVMPVLCLYADLLGIIGGAMVTIGYFDVSLTEFFNRTRAAVQLQDFFVGLGKCAVFGVLIAVAGCLRGIQCGRSASAVGDAATSAVVTSIVLIVVADSIITLICNRLGI